MLKRLDFNGNAHVGVYCRANDTIAFVEPQLRKETVKTIRDSLGVEVVELTIGGSSLIGSLMALNSYGMVVADFIEEKELAIIKEHFEGEVLIIDDKFNAAGNNILVNDHGAITHPLLEKTTVRDVQDTLNVEVVQAPIAELNTVGMAAAATNRGVLCHPKATEDERTMLEDMMGVEVKNGTVNHGMPYVGAGLVANSHGAVAGITTTGIELNRIEDALDLIGG